MSFAKRKSTVTSYKPSTIQTAIRPKHRTKRKNDQLRAMNFEYDLISEASGSVYAEYGDTKLIVAIYGPKQSRFVSTFSNEGRFECSFHYAPFAFDERLTESRGKSIKEQDMASNIEAALRTVIVMEKYPKCTIEAHVWLLQCDGNILSCSINTVSMALVHAGIEMEDFITSTQCVMMRNGDSDTVRLMDATLAEERNVDVICEIAVCFMNGRKRITLLNMKGSLSPKDTKDTLQICLKACSQIKHAMKISLFKQYQLIMQQQKHKSM